MDREFIIVIVALAAFFWILGEWLCAIFRAGRSDQRPGRALTAALSSIPLWVFLTFGFRDVPAEQRLVIGVMAPMMLSLLHIGTQLTKRIRGTGYDRFVLDMPLFDPMRRPVWSAALLAALAAIASAAISLVVR